MRSVIDVVFALVWLSITTPRMTLIALLIRIESPGPILYSPHMVGQKGREFSLLHFRTMSTVMNDSGTAQRLTRVGGLIRNTSLDHLPMLINLLKGDLSLVGPRPMEIHVVELKDPMWGQYFQVKPGMFSSNSIINRNVHPCWTCNFLSSGWWRILQAGVMSKREEFQTLKQNTNPKTNKKKPPFPILRREVLYFQKTRYAGLCSLSPFTAMRHCVLSNLLDEERGTGRRRPVTGPVDRDERDRVIASLGNVYDGSITGSGVV